MKKLLVLPLLLGFSVPAIAHNEFNGGESGDAMSFGGVANSEEEEGAETDSAPARGSNCVFAGEAQLGC